DLLVQALQLIPGVNVSLDIFAVVQSGSDRELKRVKAHAARDPRLNLRPAVAPGKVGGTMALFDLVVIPSRCLETGPLVALEAFAAGVPVLGADLGGIAELVSDGVDGVLLPPDDAVAWAQAVSDLA